MHEVPHAVTVCLPPGRVRLGVVVDAAFTGEGVRIGEVGDDTPAKAAGLASGDVIVGLGDAKVANQRDLRAALAGRKHGETVKVSVRRGDATLAKDVTFPEAGPEPAFRRGQPFGVLEATRAGNAFDVTCRGGTRSALARRRRGGFAAPVVVRVNGAEVFRGAVAGTRLPARARAADDDRTMRYAARLTVKVPPRRSDAPATGFVPPRSKPRHRAHWS
jgi:membrane-associated protease RseP (regulator of RpoE activity)